MKTNTDSAELQKSLTYQFWPRTSESSDYLTMVNQETLPINDALIALGIDRGPFRSSFGISNPDMIKDRLKLVQWLFSNRALRRQMRMINLSDALPKTQEKFMEEFPEEGRIPFWAEAQRLAKLILASQNPPASLVEFAQEILTLREQHEEKEYPFAQAVREEVVRYAQLDGCLALGFGQSLGQNQLHVLGRDTHYAPVMLRFSGSTRYSRIVSEWADQNQLIAAGVVPGTLKYAFSKIFLDVSRPFRSHIGRRGRALYDQEGKRNDQHMSQDAAVVLSDIMSFVNQQLSLLSAAMSLEEVEELRQAVYDGKRLIVDFRYSEEGLEVKIAGFTYVGEQQIDMDALMENINDIQGSAHYSWLQRRRIRKSLRYSGRLIAATRLGLDSSEFMAKLHANGSPLMATMAQSDLGVVIPSPETDKIHRWSSLQEVYNREDLIETAKAMSMCRDFVSRHLHELSQVDALVATIQKAASKQGVPICVPTVSEDHIISGSGLLPVQLLLSGSRKRIVPMDGLPSLNGRPVIITGPHGGGKTEVQIGIAVNLFLAQSGLPVFGKSFTFNPKKMLGVVFLSGRGRSGSTVEDISGKLVKILEEAKKHSPGEVVVILDEMGTGTQAEVGLTLSKRVLRTLAQMGVTVIGSSQLLELPRWAEDTLDAISVRVTSDHQLQQGIGDGELDKVLSRKGLDKLLV